MSAGVVSAGRRCVVAVIVGDCLSPQVSPRVRSRAPHFLTPKNLGSWAVAMPETKTRETKWSCAWAVYRTFPGVYGARSCFACSCHHAQPKERHRMTTISPRNRIFTQIFSQDFDTREVSQWSTSGIIASNDGDCARVQAGEIKRLS